MKITLLVEAAEPIQLRQLGDALWAAQKQDLSLTPEVRDTLKAMSTTLHAEASRLEKKNG